jgi:formate dehydrogenase major subunit
MSDPIGWEAIAAIERLLADQPEKMGHDFSAATRCLASWRDALVQRRRELPEGGEYHALERVNAAISVILGGEFPLGKVPWLEIARLRQQLGELLHEDADQPATPTGSLSATARS